MLAAPKVSLKSGKRPHPVTFDDAVDENSNTANTQPSKKRTLEKSSTKTPKKADSKTPSKSKRRQSLTSRQSIGGPRQQITQLTQDKAALLEQVSELQSIVSQTEQIWKERYALLEDSHTEEIATLEQQKAQLRQEADSLRSKNRQYERKLETLGIDTVSLSEMDTDGTQQEDYRKEVENRLSELTERLARRKEDVQRRLTQLADKAAAEAEAECEVDAVEDVAEDAINGEEAVEAAEVEGAAPLSKEMEIQSDPQGTQEAVAVETGAGVEDATKDTLHVAHLEGVAETAIAEAENAVEMAGADCAEDAAEDA